MERLAERSVSVQLQILLGGRFLATGRTDDGCGSQLADGRSSDCKLRCSDPGLRRFKLTIVPY